MVFLIPKAAAHPVERYTSLGGLTVLGVGVVAAAYLVSNPAALFASVTLATTLAAALNPAGWVEYRLEPGGLRICGRLLPFPALADVRLVQLKGTVVLAGLTWPGCWYGKAWSPRLGRFDMRGSTGFGQGVLLTLQNGRRIVITPANPLEVVVRLAVLQRTGTVAPARPPLKRVH